MVHKDFKAGDKYEIIIDGEWYRYTESIEDAKRYAATNGGSVVIDINTGKTSAKWI